MRCLVVIAHPLKNSLCLTLAEHVIHTLQASGHEVVCESLYDNNFSPALTLTERNSYYAAHYNHAITDQAQRLQNAQMLILVFPTWWFGLPAILKGWFDRVWAPGIAFEHGINFGPITPKLMNLQRTVVITTLGSPSWVDRWIMRQPLKRQLKVALLGGCAPQSDFKMLSLYQADQLSENRLQAFKKKIQRALMK